jgi:hypothetical protein
MHWFDDVDQSESEVVAPALMRYRQRRCIRASTEGIGGRLKPCGRAHWARHREVGGVS